MSYIRPAAQVFARLADNYSTGHDARTERITVTLENISAIMSQVALYNVISAAEYLAENNRGDGNICGRLDAIILLHHAADRIIIESAPGALNRDEVRALFEYARARWVKPERCA